MTGLHSRFSISYLIQMTSCAVFASEIYSASTAERATQVCFLLSNLLLHHSTYVRYNNSEVDFRVKQLLFIKIIRLQFALLRIFSITNINIIL